MSAGVRRTNKQACLPCACKCVCARSPMRVRSVCVCVCEKGGGRVCGEGGGIETALLLSGTCAFARVGVSAGVRACVQR
jgi:hypothetical protein